MSFEASSFAIEADVSWLSLLPCQTVKPSYRRSRPFLMKSLRKPSTTSASWPGNTEMIGVTQIQRGMTLGPKQTMWTGTRFTRLLQRSEAHQKPLNLNFREASAWASTCSSEGFGCLAKAFRVATSFGWGWSLDLFMVRGIRHLSLFVNALCRLVSFTAEVGRCVSTAPENGTRKACRRCRASHAPASLLSPLILRRTEDSAPYLDHRQFLPSSPSP
jgi:hypothetical protein